MAVEGWTGTGGVGAPWDTLGSCFLTPAALMCEIFQMMLSKD